MTQEEIDAVQQQSVDQIVDAVNVAVKAESAEPSGLLEAVFKKVAN
jgi:TPP-dependent pyruvate/acetoin dehydrogenase alpha subunit